MNKQLNVVKTVITNLDLYHYYFPIDVLEANIDSLGLIKYIVNLSPVNPGNKIYIN